MEKNTFEAKPFPALSPEDYEKSLVEATAESGGDRENIKETIQALVLSYKVALRMCETEAA